MKTVQSTAPTIKAMDVPTLKAHLKIELDQTAEDEYLEGLIQTATEDVETYTCRQIVTATWDLFLDEFPDEHFIVLPYGNLQDVPLTQFAKYKNSSGTETTMTVSTDYLWETNGDQLGRVVLPWSGVRPCVSLWPSNPITIRFVCGWTTADLVPGAIKSAIKLICGDLYENREATLTQVQGNITENKAVKRLLWNHRTWGNW